MNFRWCFKINNKINNSKIHNNNLCKINKILRNYLNLIIMLIISIWADKCPQCQIFLQINSIFKDLIWANYLIWTFKIYKNFNNKIKCLTRRDLIWLICKINKAEVVVRDKWIIICKTCLWIKILAIIRLTIQLVMQLIIWTVKVILHLTKITIWTLIICSFKCSCKTKWGGNLYINIFF